MDDTAFAARLAESGAAIERELDTSAWGSIRGPASRRGPSASSRRCAMRRSAAGKRLRPFLTVETARALGRQDNGPRRAGRGDRMRSRLFADSRRSAGDGRRRPQARAPDHPSRLRRSDGDSRRRRAAGAGVRDPGRSGDRLDRRSARRPLRRPRARHRSRRHGRRADARHRRRSERRRRFRSRRSRACRR